MSSPVEELVATAENAMRLPDCFSAEEILPYASAALDIVRANPSMQAQFETEFLALVGKTQIEFIEVCMHSLRWPNLKREFEAQHRSAITKNDWNAEQILRHILDAFEDGWEDAADFYRAYFLGQEHSR